MPRGSSPSGCDDGGVRRLLVVLIALCGAVGMLVPVASAAPSGTGNEPPITIAGGRSLTECISANPKPGCTTARDTDGHQLAVLGVMFVAIAFVFWRILRAVRQRDRDLNHSEV